MSKFGGEAFAGLHGKPTEIWTEEYIDRIYKNQVAMLDKIPFLRGASPWTLMDFDGFLLTFALVPDKTGLLQSERRGFR